MSVKPAIGMLSVLLVILCIASTQCDVSHVVLGGESPVDTGTIEVLRKNISDYLVELEHGGSPQMQLKQIYSASKQIVTGTLYRIQALLETPEGAKKCQIRVLEKPWIDFCQVRVTCEHGGYYEVTFNPNQISQDVSQELKPISNYLPASVLNQKPETHNFLNDYQPASPSFDFKPQPQQAFVSQNSFSNQFTSTHVQHQQQQVTEFTTFKPLPPLKYSVNPPHPFEFKPTQTPVFKPQPVHKAQSFPTLAPLPSLAPYKSPQSAYKAPPLPAQNFQSFPTPATFKPQSAYKAPSFPALAPLPAQNFQSFPTPATFKPQSAYKAPSFPTLAPLPAQNFQSFPTPATFKPQPVYEPQPLPTLAPFKLQPQVLPQHPPAPIEFKQPIQYDSPHEFPIKPTLTPVPLPPKPELNVLPFDQVPQGAAFDTYVNDLFHDFMAKYDREYIAEPSEMAYRLGVFKDNFHTMHEHSKSDRLAVEYSVTEFADLTNNEFERILGFDTGLLNVTDIENAEIPGDGLGEGRSAGGADDELPEHYDQREENLVTRIKFQGDCGACWAFVTTAVIEGLCAKRTKKLQEFSEQSLIDCDNSNHGCKGGVPPNAMKHIGKRGGLELESVYPFEFEKKTCRFDPKTVRVKVAGAVGFKKNDEVGMAKWLFKNGPILVGINADPLKYYKGGVLNPTPQLCNPKKVNHAVTLIGYGVEVNTSTGEKLPYWIAKNQWGTRFGEDGYFRIARGKNACGLALWAYSVKLSNIENNCLLNGA